MKKMINSWMAGWLVFFLFFGGFCPTLDAAIAQNGIHWVSYEEGFAASQKEGKKIFMSFYADWCGYCKKMEMETFANPAIINYLNEHFVTIRVNSDQNRQKAMEYGVRGLPTTWFLSENGDRIGNRPGYISANELMTFLKFIHTDSYKKMSLNDFLEKQKSN